MGESTQEPSIAREHYLAYHKAAIEISVDSATILRISEISRLNKITIAVGIIEKEGGTLYCTICFFDPEDGLVLKRRKVCQNISCIVWLLMMETDWLIQLIPLSGEKLVWGFGDSSDIGKLVNLKLPATNSTNSTIQVDQSIVKVAGVICCENYIPLLRTHFYKLGAQIWAAPTVNGSTSYGNTMKHIAVEGRVFVLSASQLALEKVGHNSSNSMNNS